MLLSFANRNCSMLVAAIFCAGVVLPVSAEKIEFSTSGRDTLPKVESKPLPQTRSALESVSPLQPVTPLAAPQYNPGPDAKRLAELDRKKNWIFARPGDSPTVEEVLKVKD